MNHDQAQHPLPSQGRPPPFWRSRYGLGMLVFGAIVAYFLLNEHRAHFFGALPFLLLLACPLMHLFMHRGHGGHGGAHREHADGKQVADPTAASAGERP